MRAILHILSQTQDAVAQKIIASQSQDPENKVEVVELTEHEPDYKALLERIFAADSVAVW